jgi:hypothetical protein
VGQLTPIGSWLPVIAGSIAYKAATPIRPAGLYLTTSGGVQTYHLVGKGPFGKVDLPNQTEFLLDRGESAGLAPADLAVLGGQIRIMPAPLSGVPTVTPAYIAVLGGISNRSNNEPYCDWDGTSHKWIKFTNVDEHDSNDLGKAKGGIQLTALTWRTGKKGEPQPLVVVDLTEGWAFIGHENSFIPGQQFDGFAGKVKVEDPTDRAALEFGNRMPLAATSADGSRQLRNVLSEPGKPNIDWLVDEKTSTLYRVLSGGDVGAPTIDKVVRFGAVGGGASPSPDAGNAWVHARS